MLGRFEEGLVCWSMNNTVKDNDDLHYLFDFIYPKQ